MTESSPLDLPAISTSALGSRGEVEPEHDVRLALSGGHPAWQRDVLAVSARIRTLLETVRPVVVRVLTFWDHAVRTTTIGGRRLEVDPSGCYRVR